MLLNAAIVCCKILQHQNVADYRSSASRQAVAQKHDLKYSALIAILVHFKKAHDYCVSNENLPKQFDLRDSVKDMVRIC